MLILPTDSGYNSPCDGIAPSSLQSSSEKFSEPCINSNLRRKLHFKSHTCWDSGSYFTTPSPRLNNRSREIARRLIQICDSFDKELAEFAGETKNLTWAAFMFRIIGF